MTAKYEDYKLGNAGLEAFAERYRSDPGARRACSDLAREFGMPLPADVEARVAEDSDDVTHVVFPPNPNDALADESLVEVSGGVATIAGSSAACIVSTVSSLAPPRS